VAATRAFIAIEVEETILERLRAVQQHLRTAGAQVTWVREEGMHLTLKFLGDIEDDHLPEITRLLQCATSTVTPFPFSVAHIGGFPTIAHPRVLWAGISDGAGTLCALADAVAKQLASCGFPREDRSFTPHITLGRVKSLTDNHLPELLRAHAEDIYGEMSVSEIHLMRSELSPAGARYTILQVIPLDSGCRI